MMPPNPLPEPDRDGRPPAAGSPAARSPERSDWKPGVRWFAAEFLVVVTGILVALALNAWWSGQQSAAREAVYLRQLAGELTLSESRFENSLEATAFQLRMIQSLLVAFTAPTDADPDSIQIWLAWAGAHDVPFLSLGVARGLASGDISVVRDDSVRTALFGLLEGANQYERYNGQTYQSFIDYYNRLRAWSPAASRIETLHAVNPGYVARYYPVLPFDPERRVAFRDEPPFLTDRDAHRTIDGLFDTVADMRALQETMLGHMRRMQDVLERHGIEAPTEPDRD
jgi:hypothetical protein